MLRHIQRFGKNTDHAGAYGESRAAAIILSSDVLHYTTDTVQRAIQVSEEMDISGLSLRKTAALAEKIAHECRIDGETLEKIRMAFLPVNWACQTEIGSDWDVTKKLYARDKVAYALFCRETLKVMKKHRGDPDIFKAGKQFLSYPSIKEFMTESAQTDAYWQKALSFIDNPATTVRKRLPGAKP